MLYLINRKTLHKHTISNVNGISASNTSTKYLSLAIYTRDKYFVISIYGTHYCSKIFWFEIKSQPHVEYEPTTLGLTFLDPPN